MIKPGSIVEFLDLTHGKSGWIRAHSVGIVRDSMLLGGCRTYRVSVVARDSSDRTADWAVAVDESQLRVLASGAPPEERPFWQMAFRRIRLCWACKREFVVSGCEVMDEEPPSRWLTIDVQCPHCGAWQEVGGNFSGSIEVGLAQDSADSRRGPTRG